MLSCGKNLTTPYCVLEDVNCHLQKILNITDLTQEKTCEKTSENNFLLNNDHGIRSVIKKIKSVCYLAFVAINVLHKS